MNLRSVNYGPFDPMPRITKIRYSRRDGKGFGIVVNVKIADYGSTSTTRNDVYYDWHRSALRLTVTLPTRRYTWACLFTNKGKSRTMPAAQRFASREVAA